MLAEQRSSAHTTDVTTGIEPVSDKPVIVGVDGSLHNAGAVEWAAEEADHSVASSGSSPALASSLSRGSASTPSMSSPTTMSSTSTRC